MTFSILYVCTGNICRSPFAELLTRARLDAALEVEVASAGTRGLVGHPMDPAAAAQLRARGVDAGAFRARELSNAMIQDADLVLTATKTHREAVLAEEPRALRRTFTLLEFADLVQVADGSGTPQALVARAATLRGSATLADYDVPDPIGGSDEVHARVAATVTEALDPILDAVVAAALRAAD